MTTPNNDDDSPALSERFDRDGFVLLRQKLLVDSLLPWHALFERLWEDLMDRQVVKQPLGIGVKHGFKEIVQRSPGRYELSLLHHDEFWLPRQRLLVQELKECLSDIAPPLLQQSHWHQIHIANLSFVVSTPGAATQGWHADGPHLSLTHHLPCHCLNLFISLQDMPTMDWGPTQLRPGSHVYTRNLAPMLLAARARRQLRPTVAPLLQCGDVLALDYRTLHRGLANTLTPTDSNPNRRVLLVLTVARQGFQDRLNFPSRSIYDNNESKNGTGEATESKEKEAQLDC